MIEQAPDAALHPSAPGVPVRERAVQFGRHRTLVGVLAEPAGGPVRRPVLLLAGGIIHRVGPSRALVHIARTLAAAGHPCLRFDLSGIGDSARASEPTLQAAAVADIDDAITRLCSHAAALSPAAEPAVTLIGFCSGADNALHVAPDDPRVRSLVLFDPTVPRTTGFTRRELHRRLHSHESFLNVVTGRALAKRLAALRDASPPVFPPEHYGLLTSSPEALDARVACLSQRGVRRLWVLSSAVASYCNAPQQVEEALPRGWSTSLDTVAWAPELDHVLSTRGQLHGFARRVVEWLGEAQPSEATPR